MADAVDVVKLVSRTDGMALTELLASMSESTSPAHAKVTIEFFPKLGPD